MASRRPFQLSVTCVLLILVSSVYAQDEAAAQLETKLKRLEIKRDICVMLGCPDGICARPCRTSCGPEN